ncbi:MAG: type II toxin-antitoxin system HigB family toxin [Burkholderiaceae bacterium]
MRIFNKSAVEFYAGKYAPARESLRAWYAEATRAVWPTPEHLKAQFPKASIVANNRVVFDIAGGGYRLVVSMNYKFQAGYIKFFGTHAEYDRINAAKVDHTGVHHD